MTYQETATQIIKESIKSAIFIDENALSCYEAKSETEIYEESLSQELHKKFKECGISLAVHRFEVGNENESILKQYLFDNRDLVLLDWKLDGEQGEDYSLQFLSEIVNRTNIHFCVIYTSEPSLDSIYGNILSYFSGKTKDFYINLKEKFEAYENELKPLFENFNSFNLSSNGRLIPELNKIEGGLINKLIAESKISDGLTALKHLKIAFDKYSKSITEQPEPEYDLLSPDQKTLVINNTIISIVNKANEATSDAQGIIEKFSNQIANSKNSFTQLLGLEMQSVFSSQSSFIDASLLKVSKEALLLHRKHLLEKENSDIPFKALVKNVLIEHANLSLRSAKLSLLNNDVLDSLVADASNGTPSDEELMSMNVFYNSVKINHIGEDVAHMVNFGDVFVNANNEYFICITALCDCLRPDKIKSNYFFAMGKTIDSNLALKLGDSAFISFLSENIVVSWVAQEIGDDDETHKFKPVYIKPLTYNLKTPEITNSKIEIRRLITKESQVDHDNGDFDWQTLEFVTTIRPSYAQRIANHTFTHPVRVGVDFVKKN